MFGFKKKIDYSDLLMETTPVCKDCHHSFLTDTINIYPYQAQDALTRKSGGHADMLCGFCHSVATDSTITMTRFGLRSLHKSFSDSLRSPKLRGFPFALNSGLTQSRLRKLRRF